MTVYGQNCRAEQTRAVELANPAQQPEAQFALATQFAAHVPPLVMTHVLPAQQSNVLMHAFPGAAHVDVQNPRGAQASVPVFCSGAQQPDAHCEPDAHIAAQNECAPAIVSGVEQIPEQHWFGRLVQSVPGIRQAELAASTIGMGITIIMGGSSPEAPASVGALSASRGPPVIVVCAEEQPTRNTEASKRQEAIGSSLGG